MRSIFQYNQLLPAISADHRILLGEGQTPLVRSKQIGKELGIPELHFKLENLNPTGSYKDRFAAMFVSLLQSRNIPVCLATSSGNTGAALAAYCAAANIKCVLAIVDGAPVSKIKQMQVYGASTYMIKDFGKDVKVTNEVFDFLEMTAASMDIPLPISAYHYCSEGMVGVQTISYEIMEEMEGAVDHIFVPAGGGGLTLAIARGVKVSAAQKQDKQMSRVNCVQPRGNDTIASALRNRSGKATPIAQSTTTVSGLQVPSVLDGNEVIVECLDLGGNGYVVDDDLIFEIQRKLALQEGIFCEPAGAVALAGLVLAAGREEVNSKDKVVCLITGSGFKDMGSVDQHYQLSQPEKLENIHSLKEVLTQFI